MGTVVIPWLRGPEAPLGTCEKENVSESAVEGEFV